MKFCPKNGSILMPKKEGTKTAFMCKDGGKITTKCKVCDLEVGDPKDMVIKESVKEEKKDLEVIDKGELETLPITEGECPKCKNDKAYYWLVQTRASDEPQTKFMRCTKCGHTWRDYN